MTNSILTESVVLETLRQVIDPELGCNIVDLGLVYGVTIAGGHIRVNMTLTTPGCPMSESLGWGVKKALLNLTDVTNAEVEFVFDPPWHPSMMSDLGRAQTGVRNF